MTASSFALIHADPSLQAGREIVLAAVQNDVSDEAFGLKYASTELCSAREIAFAAAR